MDERNYILELTGDEYSWLTEMTCFALCHKDFQKRFEEDSIRYAMLNKMEKLYSHICWEVKNKKDGWEVKKVENE